LFLDSYPPPQQPPFSAIRAKVLYLRLSVLT
jgi:hypothetical protein